MILPPAAHISRHDMGSTSLEEYMDALRPHGLPEAIPMYVKASGELAVPYTQREVARLTRLVVYRFAPGLDQLQLTQSLYYPGDVALVFEICCIDTNEAIASGAIVNPRCDFGRDSQLVVRGSLGDDLPHVVDVRGIAKQHPLYALVSV